MDWFYEYCDGEEFKRPENLNFSRFCLVAHVWLKSKWMKMNQTDRVWLMTELLKRGNNRSQEELGLFIDCARLAVKREFEASALVDFIVGRLPNILSFDNPFTMENALKLFLLARKDSEWVQSLGVIIPSQEFDDFCFIPYKEDRAALQVHVLRKLVLFKPFLLTPEQFNFVFIDSESEFIKALHKMLLFDSQKFIKFYTELVQLTDPDVFGCESPAHLSFFCCLRKLKFPLPVRQFHTLLRLKCELESENHELLQFLKQF